MGFALRSMTHSEFVDSRYDACDKYGPETFCYCPPDERDGCGGRDVLRHLSIIYPLINP